MKKISTRDLDRDPVEVAGDQGEDWVQESLARAAPPEGVTGLSAEQWAAQSHMKTAMRLEKIGTDYLVQGTFQAKVPTACSRCADRYDVAREGEFRLIFHPLARGEQADDDTGDPDYIFLESDEIDVCDVLKEQVVLHEPVAECPERAADGSCTLCKKNPQFEAGQSEGTKADSPFSKLKILRG